MTVSKERKAELTAQFGNTPVDTGNPKVQVAILSERIKELTEGRSLVTNIALVKHNAEVGAGIARALAAL